MRQNITIAVYLAKILVALRSVPMTRIAIPFNDEEKEILEQIKAQATQDGRSVAQQASALVIAAQRLINEGRAVLGGNKTLILLEEDDEG